MGVKGEFTMAEHVAPGAKIDLQLHTVHSDGEWAPTDLIQHLAHEEFAVAAITDHDNMEQVSASRTLAASLGVILLPAVEMTTRWQAQMVDVLCFGFDPEDETAPLRILCRDVMRRQQDNTRAVFAALTSEGYDLPGDPAALQAILDIPSADQPHKFVYWLSDLGLGTAERSAGRIAVEAGLEMVMTDIALVVDAAHRSGAVCLVAHPGRVDLHPEFTPESLDLLRSDVPIDGIEVYYPKHSRAQEREFKAYARQHNLLISAGSDSHGADNPPITFRADQCRGLLARLGVQVG